jgi:hypothetical protein
MHTMSANCLDSYVNGSLVPVNVPHLVSALLS